MDHFNLCMILDIIMCDFPIPLEEFQLVIKCITLTFDPLNDWLKMVAEKSGRQKKTRFPD